MLPSFLSQFRLKSKACETFPSLVNIQLINKEKCEYERLRKMSF